MAYSTDKENMRNHTAKKMFCALFFIIVLFEGASSASQAGLNAATLKKAEA